MKDRPEAETSRPASRPSGRQGRGPGRALVPGGVLGVALVVAGVLLQNTALRSSSTFAYATPTVFTAARAEAAVSRATASTASPNSSQAPALAVGTPGGTASRATTPPLPGVGTANAPRASTAATTAATTVAPARLPLLKIPIYRQQHALSCEAASLRMAMAALGRQVSEEALLGRLAVDPTRRTTMQDGTVQWGDPDAGFVGKWDGRFLEDGYGVYEGPIARVAADYGFAGTEHLRNANPVRLYDAVGQGFPVVVWVPYDLQVKGRGFWTTPAGKRVDYVVTEHAVVLADFDGEKIRYADPMRPDLQSASLSAFEAAFAELGKRAVIVRP